MEEFTTEAPVIEPNLRWDGGGYLVYWRSLTVADDHAFVHDCSFFVAKFAPSGELLLGPKRVWDDRECGTLRDWDIQWWNGRWVVVWARGLADPADPGPSLTPQTVQTRFLSTDLEWEGPAQEVVSTIGTIALSPGRSVVVEDELFVHWTRIREAYFENRGFGSAWFGADERVRQTYQSPAELFGDQEVLDPFSDATPLVQGGEMFLVWSSWEDWRTKGFDEPFGNPSVGTEIHVGSVDAMGALQPGPDSIVLPGRSRGFPVAAGAPGVAALVYWETDGPTAEFGNTVLREVRAGGRISTASLVIGQESGGGPYRLAVSASSAIVVDTLGFPRVVVVVAPGPRRSE